MPTYLEIAVYVPQVAGVFHYHLPPELEGQVLSGHLVVVPFGVQTVQGVVLQEVDEPAVPETRPVKELVDPEAVLTPVQMRLARHLSKTTLAPLASCIGLMLPTGLLQQSDTVYSLAEAVQSENLTDLQTRFVKLLKKRGPLRGRQIDRALPRIKWRIRANILAQRGVVVKKSVLPTPTVRPKQVRTVQLAVSPNIAQAQMHDLGRTEATRTRRQAMLHFLIREPEPVNVSWVYAESGGNLHDLHTLAEKGLVFLRETETWRDPLEGVEFVPETAPALTPGQESVWKVVKTGLQSASQRIRVPPFLLHGVTGSGKTEIYLRAVAEIIRTGKQAIVLVPEIALTPQTVRRFMSRFPGQVGLVHSHLSPGERYDTWRRARGGLLPIIIGPRSALFTPLPNLGLIVLDESHDSSYYQSELPFYHAREAAIAYAQLTGAVCMLGSATPRVESTYQARQGKWQLLRLPDRILAHKETIKFHMAKLGQTPEVSEGPLFHRHSGDEGSSTLERPTKLLESHYRPISDDAETTDLPSVWVVDMRQELKAGNRSIFSWLLREQLGQTLKRGQQAILFLNRRGSATYVFCRDCGHSLRCPRCDVVSLTYHRVHRALVCHHCGYQRNMPETCPQCKSTRIRQYGTGTEKVENEVQNLFPKVRTLRWDWETTRKKGAHELILSHFTNHRADVLIGTQMLAKGLDLPLVTLVGVVLADVGLSLPDYRAGERTFQVLTQVAGRAGRSPLGGQVVLQTFDPDHYVTQAVSRHDYAGFYQQELKYRRELGYPPFSQLVRLEFRHTDASQAEAAAQRMANLIHSWLRAEDRRQTELIGPTPCFFTRLDGQYRWQIILRGPNPASLLHNRKLADWRVEVNPESLL